MLSPKEQNRAVLPCSQAQRSVCAGWRPPPFQTRRQGLCGDKPVGSLGLEGTEAHSYPQGKLRGKGKPTSPLWFPLGAKAIPKPKRKESRRPSLQLLTKSLILASI